MCLTGSTSLSIESVNAGHVDWPEEGRGHGSTWSASAELFISPDGYRGKIGDPNLEISVLGCIEADAGRWPVEITSLLVESQV